ALVGAVEHHENKAMAATTSESVAVRVQSGLNAVSVITGGQGRCGDPLRTGNHSRWQLSAGATVLGAVGAYSVWRMGRSYGAEWLPGTYSLVAMPAGLISSFYRTTGDLPRSQWMGNIQQVLLLSLVATVLVFGGGMRAVAAWQLLPLLAVTGFIIWDVRRKAPQLAPTVTKAKFQVFLSMLRSSVLFGLLMVSNALTVQGSVLVVSSVLGGMAVAVFVISRTLANLIRQLVGAMNSALWPDLTIMESSGALERLRRIHKLLVAGSSTLCIAIAAALWYEG